MHAIDYFATTLPARPHCANDPQTDNRIRSRAKALGYRLVEPNTSGSLRWLTFDIDRPGAALDWEDRHVPAPTIACQNPENGHAHLLYALSAPVARTSAARIKPLHYAEMIEHSLRTALQADVSYGGNLVKNPMHPHWRTTAWAGAYSLDELADNLTIVPRKSRAANEEIAGLGRNCETFEKLRLHAYKAVREFWGPNGEERFHAHLLAAATDMQGEYLEPLPYSEVKAIAKSVGRWVWRNFDREKFRRIQAHRGSKKGQPRREQLLPQVIEMSAQGHSNRLIASTLGIDDKTVGNWLRGIRT